MIAQGWYIEGQDTSLSPVIIDPEFASLVALDDPDLGAAENAERRLVACPWPPEEDEVRLESLLAEMKQAVLGQEKLKQARREATRG